MTLEAHIEACSMRFRAMATHLLLDMQGSCDAAIDLLWSKKAQELNQTD